MCCISLLGFGKLRQSRCFFTCRCSLWGVDVRNFMSSFYTKLNETKSHHSLLANKVLSVINESTQDEFKQEEPLDAICNVFYSKDAPSYFVKLLVKNSLSTFP